MSRLKRAILPLALAVYHTAGCASSTGTSVCGAGALSTKTSGEANFSLVPESPDVTIYPGQKEQISVLVSPVGAAQGTVTLGGSIPAQGLYFLHNHGDSWFYSDD